MGSGRTKTGGEESFVHTWNPEDYQRHSFAQQAWAREVIAKLRLAGDERVPDLGCGKGKITAEIAARLPRGSVLDLGHIP